MIEKINTTAEYKESDDDDKKLKKLKEISEIYYGLYRVVHELQQTEQSRVDLDFKSTSVISQGTVKLFNEKFNKFYEDNIEPKKPNTGKK